ncbi:MAG: VTT domain-containing protein [Parcubacteria group bacterium]|nr:VTT domain-containing protein [Parcubacteria group bacterium]
MPDLVTIVQTAGIVGLTAIIFAESGLFFGFFLPGDSLLFTAGFLASQGFFNIWLLAPLMAIAAIAGDSVGYWTGKKVGPMLFTRPDSLLFSQQRVHEAKLFFEKYGAMSIVLARFIPAVRTFTPIVAGVAEMRYQTFLTYNVVGGIVWGACFPIAGYFLGSIVPDADRYVLPIVGLIIVVSLAPLVKPYLAYLRSK